VAGRLKIKRDVRWFRKGPKVLDGPWAQLHESRAFLAGAQLPVDDPRLAYLRGAWAEDGQPSFSGIEGHPDLELQARVAVMSLDAAELTSRALAMWTRWLVVATFALVAVTGVLIWVTAFPPNG
jgi:hypothetical protein